MSKVGAVLGREGDATPFTEVTVDNISNTLHRSAKVWHLWSLMAGEEACQASFPVSLLCPGNVLVLSCLLGPFDEQMHAPLQALCVWHNQHLPI